MNIDRFGLPPAAVDAVCGVFAAHPHVEQSMIYGLRAKGNYKAGSDIDLTLHGEELRYEELLTILSEIDDLLLPYTVDLSLFRMIDHAGLRDHIQRMGQDFYRRKDGPKRSSPHEQG